MMGSVVVMVCGHIFDQEKSIKEKMKKLLYCCK